MAEPSIIQILPDGEAFFYWHDILEKTGRLIHHQTSYNGRIWNVQVIKWGTNDKEHGNRIIYEYQAIHKNVIGPDPKYQGSFDENGFSNEGLIQKVFSELENKPEPPRNYFAKFTKTKIPGEVNVPVIKITEPSEESVSMPSLSPPPSMPTSLKTYLSVPTDVPAQAQTDVPEFFDEHL